MTVLLVPGILTALLLLVLLHEGLAGVLCWSDVKVFLGVWAVLMAISVASILSA